MFFQKYVFGDTALYFSETTFADRKSIGLTVLPKSRIFDSVKFQPDPLIQVAFTGDRSLLDYSRGISMQNRESTVLHVEKQTADKSGVETFLTDGAGNYYTHVLRYDEKTGVFRMSKVMATMIIPIVFGIICFRIILMGATPSAFAASTYSCDFS